MMGTLPRFETPARWENQNLYLYHGTIDLHAKSIRTGVDVERGLTGRDFGRGFYTTTIKRQARAWAWQIATEYNDSLSRSGPEANPVVFRYQVDRNDFANLQVLSFVRGDHQAEDYWSFVYTCRSDGFGHGRQVHHPRSGEWYDVVIGPVAAFWRTRLAIADADQISFHTQPGADLLNGSPRQVERVRWS